MGNYSNLCAINVLQFYECKGCQTVARRLANLFIHYEVGQKRQIVSVSLPSIEGRDGWRCMDDFEHH